MQTRRRGKTRQGKRAASAGAQWVWCTVTGLTTTTTTTTTMPRLPRAPFKDVTGAGARVGGGGKAFLFELENCHRRKSTQARLTKLLVKRCNTHTQGHMWIVAQCSHTCGRGEGRGIARQLARVSSQRFMASFTRQSQLFAKGEEELRLSEGNLIKFI